MQLGQQVFEMLSTITCRIKYIKIILQLATYMRLQYLSFTCS